MYTSQPAFKQSLLHRERSVTAAGITIGARTGVGRIAIMQPRWMQWAEMARQLLDG